MLCPKCNVECETRFCNVCGADLGVYRELASLRIELESLQARLSTFIGERGTVQERGVVQPPPLKQASSSLPYEAASEPKPPPLPPIPQPPKLVEAKAGSTELALGQKWFLGIGVLVMIIGIGFFLKYAFEQEWLGPGVQIAAGFFCGVILLFVSNLCHRREMRGLDVGVGASGLGALYLSGYAAYQVHHLLPPLLSIGLILIVTLTGACLATLWNSQSLAVLTFVGAYLAPLLFASERFSPWVLLGYLGILALGGQFLAFTNGWRVLYVIGALLTWLDLVDWAQRSYLHYWFLEAFVFTQFLFAAFSLMPFIRALLRGESDRGFEFVLAAVNGLLCCWYSAYLLDYEKTGVSLVSLCYAIVCLTAGLLGWKPRRLISSWLIAQGLTFLLVYWSQALSGNWIVVFWSAEAVVLYWVAAKSENRSLVVGAAFLGIILVFAGLQDAADFFFSSRRLSVFTFDFESRWTAAVFSIGSLLGVAWLDRKALIRGTHPGFNRFYEALGVLRLFLFVNIELLRLATEFMRRIEVAAISVLWSLFAVGLMTVGILFRRKIYRLSAIGLLFATVLKVLVFDTADVATPYRILSCMVLGAILVVVSFVYYRFSERLTEK